MFAAKFLGKVFMLATSEKQSSSNWEHETWVTSCELRVISYELKA